MGWVKLTRIFIQKYPSGKCDSSTDVTSALCVCVCVLGPSYAIIWNSRQKQLWVLPFVVWQGQTTVLILLVGNPPVFWCEPFPTLCLAYFRLWYFISALREGTRVFVSLVLRSLGTFVLIYVDCAVNFFFFFTAKLLIIYHFRSSVELTVIYCENELTDLL